MQELRDAGYLPEAVRNYLALLGWGYDETTTFFSTEELIERFSLERVSRSPAVFDEQKLRWMNGHYIRERSPAELAARLRVWMRLRDLPGADDPRLEQACAAAQEKAQTLAELYDLIQFAFRPLEFDQAAWQKVMAKDGARDKLQRAAMSLSDRSSMNLRRATSIPAMQATTSFNRCWCAAASSGPGVYPARRSMIDSSSSPSLPASGAIV